MLGNGWIYTYETTTSVDLIARKKQVFLIKIKGATEVYCKLLHGDVEYE